MIQGIALDKPIMITFRDLSAALAPLHLWERGHLATLHDLWKRGAPTPDSRILNPKGYDERRKQAGNVEKRLVFPTMLARWIAEVAEARGMLLDWRQCLNMAEGHADYGVDKHTEPLLMFDMGKRK